MVEVRESDINIEAIQWREGAVQRVGTDFILEKKDKASGAPIAGAVIALEKELTPGAETFTFCSKKATNTLGRVEFKGLNAGRYRFKEERDADSLTQARVVIVPSDGIGDSTYYYFNIPATYNKHQQAIKVIAYVMAAPRLAREKARNECTELAFYIASDSEGKYLFARERLIASDGAIYTGNYYAQSQLDGTWQLIEDARRFVPHAQLSIEGLPIGIYYIRPVAAQSWQKSVRFHVTNRTRAVFIDYAQRRTYELLKSDQVGAAVASFSNKYKREKKRKQRKRIFIVGTIVFGLSLIGVQLKQRLDD
jgi:hypothetical protein